MFAHKGKLIPCWFPGIVMEKSKKGFKIEFYAGLEKEDCVTGNMMLYSDNEQKKKNVGMELASVQCSSNKN